MHDFHKIPIVLSRVLVWALNTQKSFHFFTGFGLLKTPPEKLAQFKNPLICVTQMFLDEFTENMDSFLQKCYLQGTIKQ